VNEVHPQSSVPEHVVSPHVRDPMPQRDSGSDSPHDQSPTSLRERGRDVRDSGSDSPHA